MKCCVKVIIETRSLKQEIETSRDPTLHWQNQNCHNVNTELSLYELQ